MSITNHNFDDRDIKTDIYCTNKFFIALVIDQASDLKDDIYFDKQDVIIMAKHFNLTSEDLKNEN